jgi:glycerophosphoryl diester phosphodiesterase
MILDAFKKVPFAHRTLHNVQQGRPENSVVGAKAGMAAGYGLEIDLQMSSDDVPVVFHDDFLQRLTPRMGLVKEHTVAELSDIRLSHGNECIPTFEEILKLVNGVVPLLVEIKDQDGAMGPNTGEIERATCSLLENYKGDVALMSFNPHSVAKCKQFAPNIPRGLVTDQFGEISWPMVSEERRQELRKIPDYDRVEASFISHNFKFLNTPRVKELRAAGAGLLCWTIMSASQDAEARKLVDNVTFEGYLA